MVNDASLIFFFLQGDLLYSHVIKNICNIVVIRKKNSFVNSTCTYIVSVRSFLISDLYQLQKV